jgi:hypothetical protein
MGQRNPAPVDMFYPIIYRVSTIQGGAGYLPSTVLLNYPMLNKAGNDLG